MYLIRKDINKTVELVNFGATINNKQFLISLALTDFRYLALLRFNLRRIRTSEVSPGKELLVLILLGDADLERLASPIDATIKHKFYIVFIYK